MYKISLYIMATLYFAAGINHFVHPQLYMRIMPRWLPWHWELVIISGVCEMVFALLLVPVKTRRVAAWCIIALLIAVFPANIQMALDYHKANEPHLWLAILRLPLQLILVAWAYWYTKPVAA